MDRKGEMDKDLIQAMFDQGVGLSLSYVYRGVFDGIFKFVQTIIYLHYIQTLNMPTEVQVLPTNIKLGGGQDPL
jgi:hypothetical protein